MSITLNYFSQRRRLSEVVGPNTHRPKWRHHNQRQLYTTAHDEKKIDQFIRKEKFQWINY